MAKLIGTDPNQVPTNADLGTMAYQDDGNVNVGTINTTGDVGINTTSRMTDLTIAHNGHGLGLGYEGATLPALAGLYTSNSTNYGQAYGSLVVQSRTDYSGYSIIFRNNGGEAARFTQSGNLAFPNGQGIDFSATSGTGTSELLDDYEEGTWTPTDASGAGLTFTINHNRYTKIGRLVMAHVRCQWPTTSDTNLARLYIPFTADANSNNSTTGGVVTEQSYDSSVTLTASINDATRVLFRRNGITAVTNAQLSGKLLRFTITYNAT